MRVRARSVAALWVVMAVSAGCDFGHAVPTAPDQSNVAYATTDLTLGTGTVAAAGSSANVTYAVWLYSDTAQDHKGTQLQGGTFSFVVGANPPQVIKGFDQAVTGMAVGGTRRAIVPPSLAYGSSGSSDGAIPPNAAIVFEIQLNAVQ
jgi:FKBP-type peptidyl-prolyl cis-trans isomerase FkpA